MPNVPLSPEDLDRAAQAVRRHAILLLLPKFGRDQHEAALHRDLANRFEAAARLGRQPIVPEDAAPARKGPPPAEVDTFPVCAEGDGVERCVVGADKHPGCYMTDEEAYGMSPAQRQEVARLESTLLKRRANRGAEPAAWGDSPHDQEPRS